MKKKLFILGVVGLMVCLIGSVAIAGGPSGQAGESSVGHLYLYQEDGYGNILAWGEIKYNPYQPQKKPQAFQFVFNGHGLEPGAYKLIYLYPDNQHVMCFGSGTAEANGNLHIAGILPGLCDLTPSLILLVFYEDVDCNGNVVPAYWDVDLTDYLIGDGLIGYDDPRC